MAPPPPRWVAVARSADSDPVAAGRSVAREALAGGRDPALLVLFASEAYDLPTLLAAIGGVRGDVPLVGCSTAGEIASGGPGAGGVVCAAFGGEFDIATAVAAGASADLRRAGAEAAACGLAGERSHRVVMLLTDGLSGDQHEVVRGAHGVLGSAVPLVGGCAGDDLRMRRTHQFHGSEVLTDAVVAASLGSDAPFGIGVRHGWRRVGDPMVVTQSRGTRVLTLDDRPALDVYLERLAAPPQARADVDAFTRFAVTHPLGLARRSGEDHVRFVAGADLADRALHCIAEVPRGGVVWLMEGDRDSILAATEAACADALAPLGDRPPLGMIAFDCIARRRVLCDDGVEAEVHRIVNAAGVPVAGFYTYGEIARTRGVRGFHNQTLVVLAVS